MRRPRLPIGPGHILSNRPSKGRTLAAAPIDPEKLRKVDPWKKYGGQPPGAARGKADAIRGPHRGGVPQPQPITVIVKAVGEAIVFTAEGVPIPNDRYVSVPISASIVQALRYGDLEEVEAEPIEQREPAPMPAQSAPASTPAPQRPKTAHKQKRKTLDEAKAAVRAVIARMGDRNEPGEAARAVCGKHGYDKPETLARTYRRLHRIVRADMKREEMLSASKETAAPKLSADNASTTTKLSARTKKIDPGRTEKD
jgi:hypothetical protein